MRVLYPVQNRRLRGFIMIYDTNIPAFSSIRAHAEYSGENYKYAIKARGPKLLLIKDL